MRAVSRISKHKPHDSKNGENSNVFKTLTVSGLQNRSFLYSFIPCGWISIGGAVKPYPHDDKAVDASSVRPKRDAERL